MDNPGRFKTLLNRFSKLPCPICLEDSRNNITLPCGHVSCRKCYMEYIRYFPNPVCYICRGPMHMFGYSIIFFGFPGGVLVNFCL